MTSTIVVKVMTVAETAFLLRRALGPVVNWTHWLADTRRGRGADFGCAPLDPCGKVKDRFGYFRPAYKLTDIVTFIRQFKESHKEAATDLPPEVLTVELDSADLRSWSTRGLPISSKSS